MYEIVRQCVEAGLVKGDVLAADGIIVQARAAIKSPEALNPQPVGKNLEELKKHNEKELEVPGEPEDLLFRKGPGKEANLSYLAHNLLDVRSGIIVGAMATLANGALERTAALEMLKKASPFLPPLSTEEEKRFFLADGNYTAGDFLAEVIETGYQCLWETSG
jgi:hypothetical protein